MPGEGSRPARYAFVDLETTGTDPSRDRITEIGVVTVEDGARSGEWSALVNPGVAIPPEIQSLTGIDNAMVRDSPPFADLADELRRRLAGHVFVAHNARFDYGFLKASYRRLGQRFQADVLCTLRLSRRMFPQYDRHGLDALVARHGLGGEARHRALGDARLIAEFFDRISVEEDAARLAGVLEDLLKFPARPAHLPEESLDDLPEAPGVYTFLGINRQPLYVGKARNLRDRVRSHFYADSSNSTDARLASETYELQIEETAGEFCALVREIQLIRACAPLHNLALRRRESSCFVRLPGAGQQPSYVALADFDPLRPGGLYGPFSTRQAARAALAAIARENRLCDSAIGLWNGDRPCFSHQIGRCPGLCCGEESPESHHDRLLAALAPLQFPLWPFPGPVRFTESNPDSDLTQTLRFENWCALDETHLRQPEFHPAVFKLLRRMVAKGVGRFEGG
jgi:DNA polymerase-3 subunit epsilon